MKRMTLPYAEPGTGELCTAGARLKTPEKTSGCRGQRADLAGKLGYYAMFLNNCKDCVQLRGKNVGNRGYPGAVNFTKDRGEVAVDVDGG
jgi:hypothetical protein